MNSDLNGNSPQFTLTCVSTDGPATTVTWTRGSEEVTGGITVLNNTKTAQYIHTLTVTGRLPGQYQCNVSNNKPSTATKSFTMQGDVRVLGYMQCFTSISHHKREGGMCCVVSSAFLLYCTIFIQVYCCDYFRQISSYHYVCHQEPISVVKRCLWAPGAIYLMGSCLGS